MFLTECFWKENFLQMIKPGWAKSYSQLVGLPSSQPLIKPDHYQAIIRHSCVAIFVKISRYMLRDEKKEDDDWKINQCVELKSPDHRISKEATV